MKYLQKIGILLGITALLLFPGNGMVSAKQSDGMVDDYWKEQKQAEEEPLNELEATELTTSSSSEFSFFDIFRMIAALLFVGAMLYFLLKFLNKKNQSYQKGHIISNLGGASVGSNKSIQVVKIGSKLYIVGVGENVQLLSEITDPEEIEQMLHDHNEAVENMLKPSDIFAKIKGIRGNDESKEQSSFIDQFKKQLNEMSDNRKQLKNELQKAEDKEDE